MKAQKKSRTEVSQSHLISHPNYLVCGPKHFLDTTHKIGLPGSKTTDEMRNTLMSTQLGVLRCVTAVEHLLGANENKYRWVQLMILLSFFDLSWLPHQQLELFGTKVA